MTPHEKYATDRQPIRKVGPAALWSFAIHVGSGTYKGDRRGLHVDRVWRRAPGVEPGRAYTVRVLPGFEQLYLVGDEHGRYLGVLVPTVTETEDERIAREASNRRRTRYISQIMRLPKDHVGHAVANPGTEVQRSRTQEERKAKAGRTRNGARAALAIPTSPARVA